ncbi:hypothetical protein BD413DRAFT_501085 [Trametes elegans]|nr:hypothetical protein BD413DRAFT_501085 [Trametes elegans]
MPSRRDIDKTGAASGSREVNTLLHTLRGEHFRHSQNLRRSTAHLAAAASYNYNDPSLPFSDIYKYVPSPRRSTSPDERAAPPPLPVIREGRLEHGYPRGPVPGPPTPKSWSGLFRRGRAPDAEQFPAAYDPALDKGLPAFRRRALSLVLSHLPQSFGSSDVPLFGDGDGDGAGARVPPLAHVCLRVLLALFPDAAGFRDELLPAVPEYFRRDILRYTAVHDPLPNAKLYPLLEPEGHAEGDLIVVGPQATLQRDHMLRFSPGHPKHKDNPEEQEKGQENHGEGPRPARAGASTMMTAAGTKGEAGADEVEEDEDSWEAESSSEELAPPLHALVVLAAALPAPTLFAFPPILTRLALLALPAPAPVHRLPRLCPLLEVLDLSYNPWLNEPPGAKGAAAAAETVVQRVEWAKLARLRVLGLRGCAVPRAEVERVNKGRWEEVEVVLEEHRTFRTTMSDVEMMMSSLRLTD